MHDRGQRRLLIRLSRTPFHPSPASFQGELSSKSLRSSLAMTFLSSFGNTDTSLALSTICCRKILAVGLPERTKKHDAGLVQYLDAVSLDWAVTADVTVNRQQAIDVATAGVESVAGIAQGLEATNPGSYALPRKNERSSVSHAAFRSPSSLEAASTVWTPTVQLRNG